MLAGQIVVRRDLDERAYPEDVLLHEAERQRVEGLRRLSQLRADLVSLVSHELRSPMAAVSGAARTLQDRWRPSSARPSSP